MRDLPAVYQLTSAQLRSALMHFTGLSITLEHFGIEAANANIQTTITPAKVTHALAHSPNHSHRRFGVCLEAFESADGGFWAICEVMLNALPGVKWLLDSKQIGSCSLSHTIDAAGCVVPLEIALVGVPARPTCEIRLVTDVPLTAYRYKRGLMDGAISSMSEPLTPAVSAEDAINQLAPAARDIVIARLAHLAGLVTSETVTADKLKRELKEAKWATETDLALLTGQLEQLIQSMPEDQRRNYSISLPTAMAAFKSGDAKEILNTSSRVIMCCNSTMAAKLGRLSEDSSGAPAAKRVKEVQMDPVVEMVVDAPPAVAATPQQSLKDLLEASFGRR